MAAKLRIRLMPVVAGPSSDSVLGGVLEWYPLQPASSVTLFLPCQVKLGEITGNYYLTEHRGYNPTSLDPYDFPTLEDYRQAQAQHGVTTPKVVWQPLGALQLTRTPLVWRLISPLTGPPANLTATTPLPIQNGQLVSLQLDDSRGVPIYMNTDTWLHTNPLTAPTGLDSFVFRVSYALREA